MESYPRYIDLSKIPTNREYWDQSFYETLDGSDKDFNTWRSKFYPDYNEFIKSDDDAVNFYFNVWQVSDYSRKAREISSKQEDEITQSKLSKHEEVTKEVMEVIDGGLVCQLEYIFGKYWEEQLKLAVVEVAWSSAKEVSRNLKKMYKKE